MTSQKQIKFEADAIMDACATGNVSRLRTLIEFEGLPLSEMSPEKILLYNHAPDCGDMLRAAIDRAHLEVVQYLKPLYPKTIDKDVIVPAIFSGSIEIFSCFLTHDPTIITRRYGHMGNCFSCAIGLPNGFEFVKFLLENGANPNFRSSLEDIPVCKAASYNNLEVLKLLRRHGAILDQTPTLWYAVLSENPDLVRFLLEEGMSPNLTKFHYETYDPPLHIAVRERNMELAKLLIEYGADISARDKKGNTLLEIAQKEGNFERIEFLSRCLQNDRID